MPHIPDTEKVKVIETSKAESVGQLCWLFADKAIDQWNKEPRWTTVHAIKRALKNPYHTEWSHQVVMQFAGTFDRQDIETAAELAFIELYRLVFSKYEDGKIIENGDATIRAVHVAVKQPLAPEGLTLHEDGHVTIATAPEIPIILPTSVVEVPAKKRGRPAGSKNKVHTEVA